MPRTASAILTSASRTTPAAALARESASRRASRSSTARAAPAARQARAATRARRGSGLERVHGPLARGPDRAGAAVGLRDQDPAAEAPLRQPLLERGQVTLDNGQNVGVHDRRAGALVLTPFPAEPMRHGDRDTRQLLRENRG